MSGKPTGIVVLGSINMDLVVRVPRLPAPGETVLGGRFLANLGGKGANQAVAAARASRGDVHFLAAVGDDAYGQQALETLGREHALSLDHVRQVTAEATGVALITVDEAGENMISVASGANLTLRPTDVERIPDQVWRNARVFLACLESPLDTVAYALRKARAHGLTTILNPAPALAAAGDAEILATVDVLTPNEGELRALLGPLAGDRPLADAAKQLVSRGAGAVVVTRGRNGCLIVAGNEASAPLEVPARMVKAVDTTAAGDAFNGALAVALAEGSSLAVAVPWAAAAASLSVTRAGAIASLPLRDEIQRVTGSS